MVRTGPCGRPLLLRKRDVEDGDDNNVEGDDDDCIDRAKFDGSDFG